MKRVFKKVSCSFLIVCLIVSMWGNFAFAVDTTAPTVTTTNPANGATDVPYNMGDIHINFSETIAKVTSSTSSITIKDAQGNSIANRISHDMDDVLVPIVLNDKLKPNTQYTVIVPQAAVKDLAGNGNASYTFSFKTADSTIPLPITSMNPADGSTGVDTNEITINFSKDMFLNEIPSDVAICIFNTTTNKALVPTTDYNWQLNSNRQLQIIFKNKLPYDSKYSVTIEGKILRDSSGNNNKEYTFSFTTADSTIPLPITSMNPADGSTGVDTNEITINFSKDMFLNEIPSDVAICIFNTTTNKALVPTTDYNWQLNSNRQLQIIFKNKLPYDSKYSVTIEGKILRDSSGNNNKEYIFTFTTASTTQDTTAPTVTTTNPADGATSVPSNMGDIHISFSETIAKVTSSTSSIAIKDAQGNSIANRISHDMDDVLVPIVLNDKLKPNTQYTVTIPQGTVNDLAGNGNAAYSFSFTTASATQDTTAPTVTTTNPADGATTVPSNMGDIHINFSETIAKVTSSTSSITIKDAQGNSIANRISHDMDDVLVPIVLNDKLKPNTQYTVTIPQGTVNDLAGNGNAAYTFSFTTQAGTTTTTNSDKTFTDVSKDHWAYQAITEMASKGILSGYSDGTFKPNSPVTREEFAKMMVSALNIPLSDTQTSNFVDLPKDRWSYKYVQAARDYLTGYKENGQYYFRGTANSEREDIAYALVKAKGYDSENVDTSNIAQIFSDAKDISSGISKYVLIAYEKGLISGYSENNKKLFKPHGTLTRAEAAQLLYTASIGVTGEKVPLN